MYTYLVVLFYTSVDTGLIVYVAENELALWIRPRIQGIGHDKEQKNQWKLIIIYKLCLNPPKISTNLHWPIKHIQNGGSFQFVNCKRLTPRHGASHPPRQWPRSVHRERWPGRAPGRCDPSAWPPSSWTWLSTAFLASNCVDLVSGWYFYIHCLSFRRRNEIHIINIRSRNPKNPKIHMDIPNIPIEARVLPEDDPGQLDVEKRKWPGKDITLMLTRFVFNKKQFLVNIQISWTTYHNINIIVKHLLKYLVNINIIIFLFTQNKLKYLVKRS